MTVVTHELKASFAFIERNFNLTRRYWGWELAFLVYSVAGALSISLIGASQGNEELLLSLMIGAIFWNYLSCRLLVDRRDHHDRALGRHPRVHDDGADPALVAAARLGRLRDGLWPHPHVGHLHRARPVLPAARPVGREPGDGRRVHAARFVQLRRDRDARRDPAAALRRARCADDVRAPVVPAAGQRGVLLGRHPAALDAGTVAAVACHVRPRGRAGRAHRREAQ